MTRSYRLTRRGEFLRDLSILIADCVLIGSVIAIGVALTLATFNLA